MPKKRFNKTLQTKPSSSAPAALGAANTSTSKYGEGSVTSKPAPSSVNELIDHLRQTQISDAQHCRPSHTPAATTVHPSLRSILSLPDTPPPRPRPGHNTMRSSGPTRIRRIPGPPPPPSWLGASKHGNISHDVNSVISRRVEQSSKLPGEKFPAPGSLQHTVLKALAANLHWLTEYDSVHLLPTQLKQILLSYVAVYHEQPEGSQYKAVNPFRLLFPRVGAEASLETASTDDDSELTRLDLGSAIGRWLFMKEFREKLYTTRVKLARQEPEVTPDSWDHEDEPSSNESGVTGEKKTGTDAIAVEPEPTTDATNGRPKVLEMASIRFSNLVHLSLALSPTTSLSCKRTAASWSELLKIAPALARLSSLSLAHWPAPTLTPHAASTYITIKNPVSQSLPGISYGGSDMYTSLDGDWTEAANLLKMFSRHLYCLQWLDLTGCGEWFAALSVPNSAEWTGAWRGLQYVGLGVGWSPIAPGIGRHQSIRVGPDFTCRLQDDDEHVEVEQKKYYYNKAVDEYKRILSTARDVAGAIQSVRKGQGKWIEFDLSPELKAPPASWMTEYGF